MFSFDADKYSNRKLNIAIGIAVILQYMYMLFTFWLYI